MSYITGHRVWTPRWGKIAGALAQAEEGQTPLQKKLAQLSKILSWLVLGICVFIFAFSLIKAGDFHLDVIISTFMVAVSLAVAASPRALPPSLPSYSPSA